MFHVRKDTCESILPFVDRTSIHRYLRIPEGHPWSTEYERLLKVVCDTATPKALIWESKVSFDGALCHFDTLDLSVDSGDLKAYLAHETSAYLVFCTLGESVVQKIKYEMVMQPASAVVLDACASEICEGYAAFLQSVLSPKAQRFSPGYGDLSLDFQKALADRGQVQKHIGVFTLASGVMVPEKSVCFVLGKKGSKSLYVGGCADCTTCSKIQCLYRRQNGSQSI